MSYIQTLLLDVNWTNTLSLCRVDFFHHQVSHSSFLSPANNPPSHLLNQLMQADHCVLLACILSVKFQEKEGN